MIGTARIELAISCTPSRRATAALRSDASAAWVGTVRFERTTFRFQAGSSSRLSYIPMRSAANGAPRMRARTMLRGCARDDKAGGLAKMPRLVRVALRPAACGGDGALSRASESRVWQCHRVLPPDLLVESERDSAVVLWHFSDPVGTRTGTRTRISA